MSIPPPFHEDWDDSVGLWRGGAKIGPEGHAIRHNAAMLVKAGIAGELTAIPAERVLANLRHAQQADGEWRGNFWWDWEDQAVTDLNSGFFTTLQLLTLHHEFRDDLDPRAQALLDELLAEARFWFRHKVYPISEAKLRYPNAYYGDAACHWLLAELHGDISEQLQADMLHISRWYLDHDWGWGEHLSDLYRKILQGELVSMLLWAREMSTELRELTETMMRALTRIDGLFAGGPCTPALRNYWMDRSPRTPKLWPSHFQPYTDLLGKGGFTQAWLARRAGLHETFNAPARNAPAIDIPCFGDSTALAWVDETYRYGAMSRYPLFPDTNSHAEWGLHWQSMPMAYWHRNGDWGYLQWLAEEDGQIHALPGLDRQTTQANNLSRLSDADPTAAVGLTRSARYGNALLVYRELPAVAATWPWAADRFRLIYPSAQDTTLSTVGAWTRLLLDYDDSVLTIACRPLQPGTNCRLDRRPVDTADSADQQDHELHFSAHHDLATDRPARLRFVWHIRMAPEPTRPPEQAQVEALLA